MASGRCVISTAQRAQLEVLIFKIHIKITTMKICIVGAGAIGGMLGVKLALTGHDVTLILRGANLTAVQKNGLKLIEEDGKELLAQNIKATSVIADAGVQDVVILSLKAHQVAAVAAELPALMHAETRVITMQNGIPWWYFHKLHGEIGQRYQGTPVKAVTPMASSQNISTSIA